ncbi:hypothetical protein [Streptomyces jumonjinensis]|uniref:hypothetical protein n=1 Tax=Streptomyces jumonjinensis TaxID=1945 RepID=UPI00379575BC
MGRNRKAALGWDQQAAAMPPGVFTRSVGLRLALFEYIDGFHNPRRIQERPDFLGPIEFEEKCYAEQATAEPTNLNTHQPILTS